MQEGAWREAARLWDRAAARETDSKRRALYEANAERARTTADSPPELESAIAVEDVTTSADKLDPGAN